MKIRRRIIATTTALVAGASIAATVLIGSPAGAATATTGTVTPVASVNLSKYIGDWYQVAAMPAWYELQCAGNAKANYKANANGTVAVSNTCTNWLGTTSTANGTARVETSPANSTLTVSFVNFFGTPVYVGGPNYLVVGLDQNYQWAVVTDPNRISGFVLSRTPSLTGAQVATVQGILKANGVDPCRLKTTPQTGGFGQSVNFC